MIYKCDCGISFKRAPIGRVFPFSGGKYLVVCRKCKSKGCARYLSSLTPDYIRYIHKYKKLVYGAHNAPYSPSTNYYLKEGTDELFDLQRYNTL